MIPQLITHILKTIKKLKHFFQPSHFLLARDLYLVLTLVIISSWSLLLSLSPSHRNQLYSLSPFSLVSPAFAADPPPATNCDDPGADTLNLADCYVLTPGGAKVSDVYNTPTAMVNLLVRVVFVVSGLLIFAIILMGGFQFITGGTKGKEQAQQMMTNAAMGFGIMFAAYWLVRVLEVFIGADLIL